MENRKIILAGLTSGYVTDYRSFRSTQPAEPRYPRREDFYGIGGVRTEHRPETAWLHSFSSIPGYHILLSHHPEYSPLIPASIQLVLSGHAHGGQWRVFNHGLFAPGQGWWAKWTRGVYEGRLVVSAGLSNTTWIPRIGNPTEVVCLEPPRPCYSTHFKSSKSVISELALTGHESDVSRFARTVATKVSYNP